MIVIKHLFLKKPRAELQITEAWGVDAEELTPRAIGFLEGQKSYPDFQIRLFQLSCFGLAVQEFVDLQFINIKAEGPFVRANFLFFESLSSLREATVAGLNGHYSASLALLRTALQQMVFHYWWRERLLVNSDDSEFYRWLLGDSKSRPFGDVLDECYQHLSMPNSAANKTVAKNAYRRLCSYAHTPTIHESLLYAKRGLHTGLIDTPLEIWLSTTLEVHRCLLDLCIASDPQSLFPVSLTRKFGFNPPMGALFDHYNAIPLHMALGSRLLEEYETFYASHEHVAEMSAWYKGFRDMSDDEILDSWLENEPDDGHESVEKRILNRVMLMKANARLAHFALVFGSGGSETDEFMREWRSLAKLRDMLNDLPPDSTYN
jgi:hypothetical protein